MATKGTIPTAADAADSGLRLGLSARRSLALFREGGGAIRTDTFLVLWRRRRRALRRAGATLGDGR